MQLLINEAQLAEAEKEMSPAEVEEMARLRERMKIAKERADIFAWINGAGFPRGMGSVKGGRSRHREDSFKRGVGYTKSPFTPRLSLRRASKIRKARRSRRGHRVTP